MKLLFFGVAKDIVGSSSMNLDHRLKEQITVGGLKEYLKERFPEFKGLTSLAVAVNSTYAGDETLLGTDDEIAIIPPVSGG